MKKFFTILVAALMVTVSASAQHEIGGIVGGLNGLSYKYWFSDALALQADLAVGLTCGSGALYYKGNKIPYTDGKADLYDFTINPNVLYHFELPANFKIYTGGGINLGLVSALENTAKEGIMGKFGINAAVGVSYDLDAAPLVLAFDFRPGYGLGFQGEDGAVLGAGKGNGSMHFSYFDWKLGFAIRYKL